MNYFFVSWEVGGKNFAKTHQTNLDFMQLLAEFPENIVVLSVIRCKTEEESDQLVEKFKEKTL